MSYMFEEGQTTMFYGGVPDALGTRRQTRQDKDQRLDHPYIHPMKPVFDSLESFELPQKCSNHGLRQFIV